MTMIPAKDKKDPVVTHLYPAIHKREHTFHGMKCWCKPDVRYDPGADALASRILIEHNEDVRGG